MPIITSNFPSPSTLSHSLSHTNNDGTTATQTRPRSRSWQGLPTFSEALTKLDVRRITVSAALGTKIVVPAPLAKDIPASSPVSPAGSTTSMLLPPAACTASAPVSAPTSPVSARSSVCGEPGFTSFTKYRVRVFTRQGVNYHYSEIKLPQQRVPSIRISPPDESPWQPSFLDPPNAPPAGNSRQCSAALLHRRTRSFEPEGSQPMIRRRHRRASTPARRTGRLATMGYNRGVNAEWRATRPPLPSPIALPQLLTTPPGSPVDSLTIPEIFPAGGKDDGERPSTPPCPREQSELPPSPPHTPQRQTSDDALSWLSQEMAISDRVDAADVQEQPPFIELSAPTTPFRCEFPDLFLPIEEEDEGQGGGGAGEGEGETPVYTEGITTEPEAIPASVPAKPATMTTLPAEILVRIFSHLASAPEVVSLALTSAHLHRVFAENSALIIGSVVRTTSPALRTLLATPRMHTTSFQGYIQTMTSVAETTSAVKSAIRTRCKNFLSKHLLSAAAADEAAFDDALFNVWTFSLRFSGAAALDDVAGQMAWLRSRRLGLQQLRDLLEVYQCIGAVLCPLTTDLSLAAKAGVVPDLGDDRVLEMEEGVELWVVYLQTLALDTLRPVVEAREEDEAGRWDAIVRQGLWRWHIAHEPARKTALRRYLKTAVGLVYAELSDIERRTRLREKSGREGPCSGNVWGETWEV